MPDIRDAESAVMTGQANFRNWYNSFKLQFQQPKMDLEIARWWNGLPAAVKASLKKADPENYEKVESIFGGK